MYPAVTQFETRQAQVERELQLDSERDAAERELDSALLCTWSNGIRLSVSAS